MVFICMHTAITTPYKQANNITGTSGYGVGLDASSSKNTTYNQSLTISQEQTMVLLWLHTAITIPINQTNNITGTYASGVYLEAYSKLQQTQKRKNTKIFQKNPHLQKQKK